MNRTPIGGRIKAVTTSSFSYYFREQEKNKNVHLNETVNFIAWEPGTGTIGSIQFEAAITANAITHAWYSAAFKTPAPQSPLLLADMQTTNGTDTSALRVQQITGTGFQVKVEEEQSKDSEVSHASETVGTLSFNQPEENPHPPSHTQPQHTSLRAQRSNLTPPRKTETQNPTPQNAPISTPRDHQ
jgi:hypothetical protein